MGRAVVLVCVLICMVFSGAAAQSSCASNRFTNRIFSACNDLPVLSSSLHWNYEPSNRTVTLAYRHTNIDSSRWIAWAINPTGTGMDGSQALVAFQGDGGRMNAFTSPVTMAITTLQPGNISFPVPNIIAEYSNRELTIYATLVLPAGTTRVNQVWQEGPLNGNSPQQHATSGANMQSTGTIDFQTGQSAGAPTNSRQKRRNVHGVLNAVSWGTLLPLGAIVARYLRVAKSADPAWFYLHSACQTVAYGVGVAGWATGLKLGSDSAGIQHDSHRNIGITLFALGTLQVFALLLRPKPENKYRFYWNIYHHATGYAVIILSVVNVYKGFDILDPEKKWKRIYTGVIIALAAIAVVLEGFTWMVVLKRRKNEVKSHHHDTNGENGMNGYGARHQQQV